MLQRERERERKRERETYNIGPERDRERERESDGEREENLFFFRFFREMAVLAMRKKQTDLKKKLPKQRNEQLFSRETQRYGCDEAVRPPHILLYCIRV